MEMNKLQLHATRMDTEYNVAERSKAQRNIVWLHAYKDETGKMDPYCLGTHAQMVKYKGQGYRNCQDSDWGKGAASDQEGIPRNIPGLYFMSWLVAP